MRANRDRNYAPNLNYQQDHNDYVVRIKKPFNWWWLLLLLLLLLFVRCERTITVHVEDDKTGTAIEDIDVNLEYTAHFLYKEGFFKNEDISRVQTTNDDGDAVFEGLPCSVYSYIFYTLSKVYASCSSECYEAASTSGLFHWTRTMTLKMKPILEDLYVRVVDDETDDPLVDATVTYKYNSYGEMRIDSLKTDPDGTVCIKDFWHCGVIEELRGSCYGYADTTKVNVPASDLRTISDLSTLRLSPIKAKITFFVKDVETKQAVVNATATVTLTDNKSRKVRSTGRTSVDGKGFGFYDDAFILAQVEIEATHPNYYDSVFVGEYTVEQFNKLPDDKRVVWMRPKPLKVDFQNVDSITGKGIPGVKNHVTITDPAGNTTVVTPDPVSNTNGFFSIEAKLGSKIQIVSSKPSDYEDKYTEITNFTKGEKIPMKPLTLDLEFSTVYMHNQSILCPDCDLKVSTRSGVIGSPVPTNSGAGTFTVKGLNRDDYLTIVASKQGDVRNTEVNNTKVNGVLVDNLKKNSDARKIPIPLTYKYDSSKQYPNFTDLTVFDMVGSTTNTVLLEWNFCAGCTAIQIFDEFGGFKGEVGYKTAFESSSGSMPFTLPTSKVYVKFKNENGHDCVFTLKAL